MLVQPHNKHKVKLCASSSNPALLQENHPAHCSTIAAPCKATVTLLKWALKWALWHELHLCNCKTLTVLQGEPVPLLTPEWWMLGRVGDRVHITQTRPTALLHPSKAKVTSRTQTTFISTSIQLHTLCSQKQTHWYLSDCSARGSQQKDSWKLICFHQVPKFPIFQIKYRECQEGSCAKDHAYFSYLMTCGH